MCVKWIKPKTILKKKNSNSIIIKRFLNRGKCNWRLIKLYVINKRAEYNNGRVLKKKLKWGECSFSQQFQWVFCFVIVVVRVVQFIVVYFIKQNKLCSDLCIQEIYSIKG